jgi:large subunit ribosomal protein L15
VLARSVSAAPQQKQEVVVFLRLNTLQDNPGAVKKKRRVGRGIGSGRGKTSGRGHKGQKARAGGKVHPTFEGGQTPFYKLIPKRGFNNKKHSAPQQPLNLGTIQIYLDMKRLLSPGTPEEPMTLRHLLEAGLFKANAVKHGVKLLADGKELLKQPVFLQVTRASEAAIEAVEKAGGQVTTVHAPRLALRSLLRPEKFAHKVAPPRTARPPPKWQPYYTSWKHRGYLNPAVQMRNWFSRQQVEDAAELEHKFQELLNGQQEKEEDLEKD